MLDAEHQLVRASSGPFRGMWEDAVRIFSRGVFLRRTRTGLAELERLLEANALDTRPRDFENRNLDSLSKDRFRIRLLSYLLPTTYRRRVFEPAYQDLLRDFAEARQFRGKWARRWLTFCFGFQTALMVLDSTRALVLDKLACLLPKHIRRWWLSGPK